ncbi:MAG: hypothetical protein DRJ32_01835 [Thermoprotei archaeon]|nr:MAG: hypothetical protein DRJ32_01835 [Thermoprotei archaeon]
MRVDAIVAVIVFIVAVAVILSTYINNRITISAIHQLYAYKQKPCIIKKISRFNNTLTIKTETLSQPKFNIIKYNILPNGTIVIARI